MASDDPEDAEMFLTESEVAARYRGVISRGTLRNWRSQKIGPAFVKIGKSALYPRSALEAWERRNTVACAGRHRR
jgi:hypothetical protein